MTRRLLLITLTCLLAACASAPPVPVPGVTILHLNDTYRIDAVEDGSAGGFGRVATLIRRLESEGRSVLLTHGGDFLYPSLESQLWDGAQMIEAFNYLDALAPLIVVPGNHEFDRRTPEAIVNAVRASNFTWLGDNYALRTGDPAVDARPQAGYVLEAGGLRLGFVALTNHAEDGGNERDYVPIDRDYAGSARRVLSSFGSDVDVILGLTHLNLDNDREVAGLRAEFPRFRLIVGGHEHEPEYEPGTATTATILKGASNARVIWRIDIEPVGGAPRIETARVAIDESLPSDPLYDAIAARWRAQLLEKIPYLEAKIGEAALPLDGREVAVRNEASNWGSFIADQMRGAFGEPSELAFVNGGTLRVDDYIMGDITFEDVGRTFGFSSWLRHMRIDGADFRALLEAGYRGSGPSKGYFPQVSGFRICVDRGRPGGERIVSLQVPADGGWREIEPQREYTLVAPDYLYRGGDGYDFSAAREVSRRGSELKYLVVDAIVRAQAAGRKIGEPTDPVNPRIVILDAERRACWL